MSARCIMVLGTSSGAGKSWVATALCRYYSNQGWKVAPFKAQNMSNNARVVAGLDDELGEIGSAQYFQALAARAEPHVRMNPLLLKPEADTHSQVVLMGRVDRELSALPWRGRSERVWPRIAAALDELRADNDIVVIEGAGSPAEINLMASDVVNLRVARHANARCLLVTDIDRGGAFAHLYGTWALLPEDDRARIAGFVLNKFRGDAALLAPAPEQLEELTGVPTVAVVPMRFGHGLPEEDGVFDDRAWHAPSPSGGGLGWGPAAPPMGAAGPSPQRGEGAGPARSGGHMDLLPLPLAGEGGGEGAPSPAGGGLGWGQTAPAIGAAGPSPQPSPQRGEGASPPRRAPGSAHDQVARRTGRHAHRAGARTSAVHQRGRSGAPRPARHARAERPGRRRRAEGPGRPPPPAGVAGRGPEIEPPRSAAARVAGLAGRAVAGADCSSGCPGRRRPSGSRNPQPRGGAFHLGAARR